MPRGARLDAPGSLHHVVVRGIERRAIFLDDDDRKDLLDRLAALVEKTGVEVLAWALLDNHFHLLLRTGAAPLSDVMRCLNTGYAVRFNRRHNRSGYLFQNRFKSFLVEEKPYLLELVRYIHLNPVRVQMVASLEALDSYPWTGHAVLLGRIARPWQTTRPVLALFGRHEADARSAYRRFVAAGLGQDQQPELTGGGLLRSRGRWLKRLGTVRGRDQWAFDERILGCGEFVERVLVEQQGAAAMVPPARSVAEIDLIISQLVQRAATCCGTSPAEIASSSRRPAAIQGRTLVASWAVLGLGIGSNAVARCLGVSRQSVRRGLERSEQVLVDLGCDPASLLGSIRKGRRLGDPA